VDGLYAHTPFLERALARQGAVLVVNQSAGEVPALASLQLHSLAARRAYAVENKHVLIGLTRAVHRALQLLHGNEDGTMQALLRAGVPGLERDLLRTLLPLYVPAMPQTPVLLPDGIRRSVSLFGTGGGPSGGGGGRGSLDLARTDLAPYLMPEVAGGLVLTAVLAVTARRVGA